MTRLGEADKVELLLIGAGALLTYIILPILPHRLSLGIFALVFSICLLAQSLIRDLIRLYFIKRQKLKPENIHAVCMCIESMVGLGGIIAGLALLFIGVSYEVKIPVWYWPVFTGFTWLFGFVIKNYVVDFTHWRIRRLPGHHNIILGR